MSIRIIYGKPGTGKSQYCFSEISNLIKENKKDMFYMITPEQFSFTAEKKLMENLEKIAGTKAVLNAEVITLSRLATRVVNETSGKLESLTKCGKAMLIYDILDKNKKKFKFLNKSDDNIELCMNIITEFKKHGILIEDIKNEINRYNDENKENIKNEYLKTKLLDVLVIYENFEKNIQEKYIDESDSLSILAKKIEDTNIIKDSYVYIDEFSGFTKQEYEIIKQIAKQAKQLNITVCTDDLELNTSPITDIFYSNKKVVSKINEIANLNNLQIEKSCCLEKVYRFKNKELAHLSENINNNKYTKYEENVENINLFLAKNGYSEIEKIAKDIQKLVNIEKYRYREIGIITKNIESYSSLVKTIFRQYNIPVFIDEKRSLEYNPIVQYILSLLEILTKNFSNESIFSFLKLGFTNIENDEIFKLENYVTKWGIKYNKWKTEFKFDLENEKFKADVIRLNEIREEIITPILRLRENINKDKECSNISKLIFEYIEEQKMQEKIQIKILELEEKGLNELAQEYKESYKSIIDILDEIVIAFKNDKITIDRYQKIFKIGLKNTGLGKIPATSDTVILGDVERSRSHKTRAIFIIGLNDGVYPSVRKDEGFLNDSDREILKKQGMEIAKDSLENLYEENFNIYKAFTTAEEKIFLSYPSSDNEGKSLRISSVLNKIKKIFPKLIEKSDVISKDYEIVNEKKTYEDLLENIAKAKKDEKIDNIWYQVYHYFKTNSKWKDKLNQDLQGLEYTNLPDDIKKENIQKLYGNTLNTSVSKLEKYSSCPYSYHLQYGLKIKEKDEHKVHNFDTGSFMHNVIDEFFEYTKNEGIKNKDIEEKEISDIIDKIVEEQLVLPKNYIFSATAKSKVLVKRLKRLIVKAIKYIIATISCSDFEINGTEVEFGNKGEYEQIKLQLDNGKNIEITGKIDRVDMAETEDGKYVRIIDYKSSVKNIDLDKVYAGLQIQLLTYSSAICKQKDIMPAGVFYFSLLEQIISSNKRLSEEEIEEQIRNQFKMKGLIVAEVKIIQMNDNNLISGTSKLVPAAITKAGGINAKNTNGITSKEFIALQDEIYKIIKQISNQIFEGKIDIMPYYKKGETPCTYCAYKSICRFDTKQKNNKYRFI